MGNGEEEPGWFPLYCIVLYVKTWDIIGCLSTLLADRDKWAPDAEDEDPNSLQKAILSYNMNSFMSKSKTF